MRRFVLLLCLVAVLIVPLAGCGKKGRPEAPGDDRYPKQYPKPT